MANEPWTPEMTARAREIWAEYQRTHDLADRQGQAVGIDPVSGRVWFGRKGTDIFDQIKSEGLRTPVYLLRVGQTYYQRKGGRG